MHEKHQASPPLPRRDSLLCNTWRYKYTLNHYNTRKKQDTTRTQVKTAVSGKKRQTRWRFASMKSRHAGVNGLLCARLYLCAASPPPPQPAASPARLPPRAEQRAAREPAGTSQAGRAIPAEPVQELEFVIRLCNAATWWEPNMTAVGYLNVLLERDLP